MVLEHEQIRLRREEPHVSIWIHKVGRGKPRPSLVYEEPVSSALAVTGKPWKLEAQEQLG